MLGLIQQANKPRRYLAGLFELLRRKKSTDSAQFRLESRTRDIGLDRLATLLRNQDKILGLQEVISSRKDNYASVQLLSKRSADIGLNTSIGAFLRKYPKIFELFVHKVNGKMCCRMSPEMVDLVNEEERAVISEKSSSIDRIKKLLMMSTTESLNVHALWLSRRELGLPEDFKSSIILKNSEDFRMETLERVKLVSREREAEAEVERWREREHRERWLSEFETRYAFPVDFPTGFLMERGFREKLKNWQRLQYIKPYEKIKNFRIRSCKERFEKRVVGIIHEFLSLTVEKRAKVDLFSHFRKDFCLEVNIRELLLKHPGIFYISSKGNSQLVYLREGYKRGLLVEHNPVYLVRRRMLDLILMGRRAGPGFFNALTMEGKEERVDEMIGGVEESQRAGEWVLPILEKSC